jgi:hypothetical protein
MELGRVVLTDNLLPVIRANPNLEILEGPFDFEFDAAGDMPDWLGAGILELVAAH